MSYGRIQEEEVRLKCEIDFWIKKAEEEDIWEAGAPGFGNLPTTLADGRARKEAIVQPREEISLREEKKRKKIQTTKAEIEEQESDENRGKAIENTKQISFADLEARVFSKMKETAVERPEMLLADAGCGNVHTLESCEKAGMLPVMATARKRKSAEGEEGPPHLLSGLVREEMEGSLHTLRGSHGVLFGVMIESGV